jgi:hypothetical protein
MNGINTPNFYKIHRTQGKYTRTFPAFDLLRNSGFANGYKDLNKNVRKVYITPVRSVTLVSLTSRRSDELSLCEIESAEKQQKESKPETHQ